MDKVCVAEVGDIFSGCRWKHSAHLLRSNVEVFVRRDTVLENYHSLGLGTAG